MNRRFIDEKQKELISGALLNGEQPVKLATRLGVGPHHVYHVREKLIEARLMKNVRAKRGTANGNGHHVDGVVTPLYGMQAEYTVAIHGDGVKVEKKVPKKIFEDVLIALLTIERP